MWFTRFVLPKRQSNDPQNTVEHGELAETDSQRAIYVSYTLDVSVTRTRATKKTRILICTTDSFYAARIISGHTAKRSVFVSAYGTQAEADVSFPSGCCDRGHVETVIRSIKVTRICVWRVVRSIVRSLAVLTSFPGVMVDDESLWLPFRQAKDTLFMALLHPPQPIYTPSGSPATRDARRTP